MTLLTRLAMIVALGLTLFGVLPAVAQDGVAPERRLLVMLKLPADHLRPGANYASDYGDQGARAARRRVAAGVAKRGGVTLVDDWPMPMIGVDCYVVSVPGEEALDKAAERIARDPAVMWAQPMNQFRAMGGEAGRGDPLYPTQPAAQWRLTDLHRVVTGRGVTVAVVDSKVEAAHPDLAGQIALDRDFVTGHPASAEQHGTGVAGIIAAKADNGIGIAGIAPGARLLTLRACWQTGAGASAPTVCDTLSLARALIVALDRGAQVINMSLSGPADPLLSRLIDVALTRRVAVVAAYDAKSVTGGFPASKPGVIAVADELAMPRAGTAYGAPGRDIPTTQPGGKWYLVNGSSYAVAHVAGLLALVREERRPASLVAGDGRAVDACATIFKLGASCDCSCAIGQRLATRR